MVTNVKRILVLSPHTDDGELGAGGTIHRLIESGKEIFYVAFSAAEESVPEELPKDTLLKEVRKATNILGIHERNLITYGFQVRKLNYYRQEILEILVNLKKEISPDLVFMPSLHDIHQDHSTVAQEGLRAFKDISILGYELLWNNLSFDTTCFVKLTKENVDKKILALQQYKSQSRKDYMSADFILSHAFTRGIQVRSKYAEAFEVIRWII